MSGELHEIVKIEVNRCRAGIISVIIQWKKQ